MGETQALMQGKKGLILGLANERSLAWGITRQVADHGAALAFTYQGEALEKRVRPLAENLNSPIIMPCDVTDAATLDALFAAIKSTWGRLDFVLHAVAFSDKDDLKGRYLDHLTRENFLRTMD